MSNNNDDRSESKTEVEKLIDRFSEDRVTLAPEVREVVERADAAFQQMQARAGKLAPINPRDNFAIGLDDNFRPFPVDPSPRVERADESTEGPDHD
jgi:hypothetical protein